MKSLRLEIPEYADSIDPTKVVSCDHVLGWNFDRDDLSSMKQIYTERNRKFKKPKIDKKLTKDERNANAINGTGDDGNVISGKIEESKKTENGFRKDLRGSDELQNVNCPEKQTHEVECSS